MSQADAAKARGNEYFKKGKLGAAIEAYSEAIALNPSGVGSSVYYSNRAFANYKQGPEERAADIEADCRKCLDLDPRSAKGNYYLGKVLTARGEFSEGLRHFQRAYDIQPPFKADVRRALWQCKKELWQTEQETNQMPAVLQLTEAAIENMKDEQLAGCSSSAAQEQVLRMHSEQLKIVHTRLATPEDPEVPQHLCCQISWAPLVDPVITPAGITYERQTILDHLSRGNNFEPVTREPLEASQLYPNKMISDAVDAFVEEHPEIFFPSI
eukprot:TRINITY_DN4693_c0_g1_i2.p1 TRINITY_DN4693_c0_g1~~TRINITY_DN4693_c0_g1_i2.p1  ORF type:complete len:269 (-),score=39.61 TRINITY_DN4693_c0_g1_i2:155-961(-)